MLIRPLNRLTSFTKILLALPLIGVMAACGGGGAKSPDTTTPPPPTATAQVASLQLKRSAASVKSDNSDSSTITVTALTATGGVVQGATIQISTATGILIPGSVLTDDKGQAKVDFSSGSSDISTRTATITASANGVSKQIPILISGSTIDVTSPVTSLPDNGSSIATLTVIVKDAGGNTASGIPVALTQSGGGGVSFTPATGNTDTSGQFVATVTGLRPGTATATISALGLTRTLVYTITPTSTTSFNIDQQTLNAVVIANNDVTPMTIGQSLVIRVNAPGVAQVVFATTQGVFNGTSSVTSPAILVVGGKATATFTSTAAGIASIQVFDPSNPTVSTDTLTAAITSAATSAAKITLQAAPNIVSISFSGGTSSPASLVATVTDVNGNPVGGAAVAFQIIAGTGGGEQISPVVQLTNTTAAPGSPLGQAKATFTPGSRASSQGGVKIRASVVGAATAVQTRDTDPLTADPCPLCGVDAAITIGGAPASIAIGQPSDFFDSADKTQYIYPMSVTVSDASGQGVSGITVSLSAFPIAWSTSVSTGVPRGCSFDGDNTTDQGTFFNEDANEDFILDGTTEDGVRRYYKDGAAAVTLALDPGTKDNKITAPPADGGVLPASATTDLNGIASFNLIYPKSSAFHIIDRIRASTIVQGTETVGELRFRLPALKIDFPSSTDCKLPASPYVF